MENRFIMTAYGKDRPGFVADVTRIFFENGCNLEDTAMTLLGDEFTLVLLFESSTNEIEALLAEECRKLESEKEIFASVRPLKKRQETKEEELQTWALHVEGVDHSGIVYKISQFLAANSLNISDLKSKVLESPGSGTKHYQMDIQTQIPAGTSMEQLEEGLSEVADDLNVDIIISR